MTHTIRDSPNRSRIDRRPRAVYLRNELGDFSSRGIPKSEIPIFGAHTIPPLRRFDFSFLSPGLFPCLSFSRALAFFSLGRCESTRGMSRHTRVTRERVTRVSPWAVGVPITFLQGNSLPGFDRRYSAGVKVKFATPAGWTISDDLPAIKISHGISRFTVDGNLDHCAPGRPLRLLGRGIPSRGGCNLSGPAYGWKCTKSRSEKVGESFPLGLWYTPEKNSPETDRAIKVT